MIVWYCSISTQNIINWNLQVPTPFQEIKIRHRDILMKFRLFYKISPRIGILLKGIFCLELNPDTVEGTFFA